MQILAPLWRIQKWARTQRRFQLYSSSILIAYDSKRLKECLKHNLDEPLKPALKLTRSHSLYRPLSLAVLNNFTDKIPTGEQIKRDIFGLHIHNITTPEYFNSDNSFISNV